MSDYPDPVRKLLTYGIISDYGRPWADYRSLGLGPEHVPDLLRMAADEELNGAPEESLRVWAPIHAWRALGQLRDETAIAPLLDLLEVAAEEWNEWAQEELPIVLGMIGPAAIPALAAFLADEQKDTYTREDAAQGLKEIAQRHPESREACVSAISGPLERAEQNSPAFNGFLVADLLDLKAVECLDVMERAFDTGNVDETIAGDWPIVQHELGYGPPPPPLLPLEPAYPPSPSEPLPSPHSPRQKDKAKARRKQAKKSRKQNCKRR
jgi:hypothetical protein